MSNIESPGRSSGLPESPDASGSSQPVQYETAKGCLSFVVVALVLAAMVCAVIIFFGEPPTV